MEMVVSPVSSSKISQPLKEILFHLCTDPKLNLSFSSVIKLVKSDSLPSIKKSLAVFATISIILSVSFHYNKIWTSCGTDINFAISSIHPSTVLPIDDQLQPSHTEVSSISIKFLSLLISSAVGRKPLFKLGRFA